MFAKVLIANRGEIALRIIRTLGEMEIGAVAVYSDADRQARFVLEADEAYYLGPAPAAESYLNVEAILSVARQAAVDAIHPGYGFLAENAAFAQAVEDAGLTFIGPSPRAIRLMGDKVEARRRVEALGVPIVPGTPGLVENLEQALTFAAQVGYPVAVKAAAGGGGRGIRVVNTPQEMPEALERARREALAYFKDASVYLERYFTDPRHVEIQVLGDRLGHLVHLGERDCSVQRRHQKMIEETPSPAVDRALRWRMGEMALRAARSVDYSSAGTVEFLLSREGQFYFLEMNTRIQVEHPITERVTGVDLIREMILAAAGEPITVLQDVLDPTGHALEVRVNAENPALGFRPTPAPIVRYREPGGIGIRLDSGVYAGYVVPQDYDSLLAKVIAWAPDRETARRRMLRALREYHVEGPSTTIPFAQAILRSPAFTAGEVGTAFVEHHLTDLVATSSGPTPVVPAPDEQVRGEERTFDVEVNRKRFQVRVAEHKAPPARTAKLPTRAAHSEASNGVLLSPMHGTVVAIKRRPGETVQQGEPLFIIEAMKMENEAPAQRSGELAAIHVTVGQTVDVDQPLAVID